MLFLYLGQQKSPDSCTCSFQERWKEKQTKTSNCLYIRPESLWAQPSPVCPGRTFLSVHTAALGLRGGGWPASWPWCLFPCPAFSRVLRSPHCWPRWAGCWVSALRGRLLQAGQQELRERTRRKSASSPPLCWLVPFCSELTHSSLPRLRIHLLHFLSHNFYIHFASLSASL